MKNQLILVTFALFCICAMNAMNENMADWKAIKDKLCDKQNKVTADQWTKLMSCKNFSKRAHEDSPNHEKLKNKWDECVKTADDVEDLKIANNAMQNEIVNMMCSPKLKDCMKDAWTEMRKQKMGNKSNMEERKARFAESVKCAKNVLGI